MAGRFHRLWEIWFKSGREDDNAATQMEAGYRSAWRSGDVDDRFAALDFLFERRDVAGFDLIIEGLKSEDHALAHEALAAVLALYSEGYKLGSSVQGALVQFGAQHPEWSDVSGDLLARLKESASDELL
ncbi:MAG: hypothetical protein HY874_12640 [Chloroflexi bacterium]|nr:hypothetical protein [Chloroflexota bacterium]